MQTDARDFIDYAGRWIARRNLFSEVTINDELVGDVLLTLARTLDRIRVNRPGVAIYDVGQYFSKLCADYLVGDRWGDPLPPHKCPEPAQCRDMHRKTEREPAP